GMQVIFEGKLPINVTNDHKVTITVHKKQEKLENNQVVTADLPDQTFDKTLTISGQKNPFTGDVKWDSDNTTGTIHIDIPNIDGYSKNEASRDVNIDMNSKDSVINVLYKLPRHTITYIYLAPDGKGSTYRYGSPVVVTGVPNQSLDAHLTAPDGYVFADPQQATAKSVIDKKSVIGNDDETIDIDLSHVITNVDHTKPVPADGKTPTNKPINGAHDSELNQTSTRTIKVTHPHTNKVSTTKQVAKIFRDATVDDVTGEVTYGDWSSDDANWTDFTPAPIAGYTPSQSDVAAVTVQNGQKDVT